MSYNEVETTERLGWVVQASIIIEIDDKYLKWVLIFNFYKRLA